VATNQNAALRFPTATSIFLDVIRFAAAIGIAVAHLTQPFFSTGWPLLTDKAKAGLVALFLLSGFVIRYVTVIRKGEPRDFVIDRVSRVYSAVLPALLFTIVASYLARAANPAFYNANWGDTMSRPLLRIFLNLIFFAQSWNFTYSPLSNEPFWTLSYEVFYYAMYGVLLYMGGVKKWIAFIVLCLLAGQHIMLLLPLWLFGCLLHDVYQKLRVVNVRPIRLHLGLLGAAVLGLLGAPLLVRGLIEAKNVVTRIFLAHHHQPINLHWAYVYYAIGIPLGYGMLWSMLLLDRVRMKDKTSLVRSIRILSEATFPIYLIHFPLFVLIASVFPYDRGNSLFKLGMLALVLIISVALAKPTNHFKNVLRDLMHRYFPPAPMRLTDARREPA
jgi:peptidoglycan/LPS O-acetylase OafA/YrhL